MADDNEDDEDDEDKAEDDDGASFLTALPPSQCLTLASK
jgi:hypothetical protein